MKLVLTTRQSDRRKCRASTIVETVLAVVIIGISATGLLGALASGFFMTKVTRENQRATQVILEKFETLRLYSWDQINTPGFIPASFTATYDPQAAANSQGTIYNGTVIIASCPISANYSNNMRQVTVTVGWTTSAVAHQRSVSTYVSKDGLQNYVY